MEMHKHQLLVIASDALVQQISKALSAFFELKMIRANSDTDAIELMVTTQFAMILMEDDLPCITPVKIAARLSNHGSSEVTPLVFITASPRPLDLFESFPSLLLDFLSKPLDPGLLKAKIKIFLELYKNKKAVAQSINELDRVYDKIMDLQKTSLKEQDLRKDMANFSSAITRQMQPPIKNIQAGIYQLQKNRDLSPQLGQGVNHIRNATRQIAEITKRISALVSLSPERITRLTDDTGAQRPCYILYVTGEKEGVDIFQHYLKGGLSCVLRQARTIAQAKKIMAAQDQDLLFIDHLLSDGTGFDLLSDLNRRKSIIPIIFTLNKSHVKIGAKAIVKGAHSFFIKENISTQNILSIIWETLEKSRLEKEIQDARERIVLISRRDHLTRLYNRQCFDQTLNREMDKAMRYQLPLSILMVDFDKFKSLNQAHGHETGDQILRISAALIKGMVRNLDMVCRYGGKKFSILLPNTGLAGAKILAQRILDAIDTHGFDITENAVHLTVSIGIASHGEPPSTNQNQDLVKQALTAVDLAVQQGGNIVQYLSTAKNEPLHD